MKKLLSFLIVGSCFFMLSGQDLDLTTCVGEVLKNNPNLKKIELAYEAAKIKKEIISSSWYPGMTLNGQFSWQSDVISFDLDTPLPFSLPEIPHDQYKATIDLQQVIYDGGMARINKQLETFNPDISEAQLAVDEEQLERLVQELYFTILILDKKRDLIELMQSNLASTFHKVSAAVENGIVPEEELQTIQAEEEVTNQQKIQFEFSRKQLLGQLGVLMGRSLPAQTRLLEPAKPKLENAEMRAELSLLDLQNEKLDLQKQALSVQNRPKMFGFGQVGYGKPGLNFLGNTWDPYALVGVKLAWNFWDWNRSSKQKALIGIAQEKLTVQREQFVRHQNIEEQNQLNEIDKLKELLKSDSQLITLRSQISSTFQSRLENGLITANDYLINWNRENSARINKEIHEMELLRAYHKLYTLYGNRYK